MAAGDRITPKAGPLLGVRELLHSWREDRRARTDEQGQEPQAVTKAVAKETDSVVKLKAEPACFWEGSGEKRKEMILKIQDVLGGLGRPSPIDAYWNSD